MNLKVVRDCFATDCAMSWVTGITGVVSCRLPHCTLGPSRAAPHPLSSPRPHTPRARTRRAARRAPEECRNNQRVPDHKPPLYCCVRARHTLVLLFIPKRVLILVSGRYNAGRGSRHCVRSMFLLAARAPRRHKAADRCRPTECESILGFFRAVLFGHLLSNGAARFSDLIMVARLCRPHRPVPYRAAPRRCECESRLYVASRAAPRRKLRDNLSDLIRTRPPQKH